MEFEKIDQSWEISEEVFNKLNEYEKQFMIWELGPNRGISSYEELLESIHFANLNKVVDAGCGIGQWTIAAARINHQVVGIDNRQDRLDTATVIKQNKNLSNVSFVLGTVDNIPLDDSSVDGVFCFGVLMFTSYRKTLQEFHRILKPGGYLYVNFNAIGWSVRSLLKGGFKNYQHLILIFRRIMGFTSNIVMRKYDVEKFLTELGDYEGFTTNFSLLVQKKNKVSQAPSSNATWNYPRKFFGLTTIWEYKGRKIS